MSLEVENLFKMLRGKFANLPSDKNSGSCYYTYDESKLYIDYEDENGEVQRKALNAKNADTLGDASLNTEVHNTDSEIPTSKAVYNFVAENPVLTTGTGSAYEATYNHIVGTTLPTGASLTIVPHITSNTTTPTLNVNGTGAKGLRRRVSNSTLNTEIGYANTWLYVNKPVKVMYDGTYWIVEGQEKPASSDLYGNVPINKGGTGATTAAQARINLGVAAAPKSTTITLPAASWESNVNPYYQVVEIAGTTANSKVDLLPSAQQIVALQNADIMLMTENDAGTISVYAIGGKPTVDYTMQVLITEVVPV